MVAEVDFAICCIGTLGAFQILLHLQVNQLDVHNYGRFLGGFVTALGATMVPYLFMHRPHVMCDILIGARFVIAVGTLLVPLLSMNTPDVSLHVRSLRRHEVAEGALPVPNLHVHAFHVLPQVRQLCGGNSIEFPESFQEYLFSIDSVAVPS